MNGKILLAFLVVFSAALSGCVQPILPQPVPECKEYCQAQPHVQCVGEWKISGTYPDCNCAFECTVKQDETCALEGEQFSAVYKDQYSEKCCEGLTEWASGMDTTTSIADKCYKTGLLAGSPVGTCINCGNGICGTSENVCNCPEDCVGKEKSTYATIEGFCSSDLWKKMNEQCSENSYVGSLPICSLCQTEQSQASDSTQIKELSCDHFTYSNCPERCVKYFPEEAADCDPGQLALCTINFDLPGTCKEKS